MNNYDEKQWSNLANIYGDRKSEVVHRRQMRNEKALIAIRCGVGTNQFIST